jgi:uncharacterized protein YbaR (Trm112 family)
MRHTLLHDLRCPYCGGIFSVSPTSAPAEQTPSFAVLSCWCCAYPIVDGIPVLVLGDEVSAAIKAIEAGDFAQALHLVLDLSPARHQRFDELRASNDVPFARAVRALLPDGEGDYYVLRFGDPTFVVADTLTRLIARQLTGPARRMVDVCGGCGHLTATLTELAAQFGGPPPLLLDRSFWRLWLARRFLAPAAEMVCCDANVSLPLGSGRATLAVCNDAFHYVWAKRLLASELERISRVDGAIILTHVHNALGDNATAGNTLPPDGYVALFDRHSPLLTSDADVLGWATGGPTPRWDMNAATCGSADAVDLVASPTVPDWTVPPPTVTDASGIWVVNPLLAVRRHQGQAVLSIQWPSEHYASEFGDAKRYLGDEARLPAESLSQLGALAGSRPDLVVRRVLLRVPENYL